MLKSQLILGNCLEKMPDISSGSIDMVMTDPPYGTTACKWDSVIDLLLMWEQLKRLIKPNGAIVMTASQPFTTALIASNMKMFKYCWVWEKTKANGFFDVLWRPLKSHEDVIVFSRAGCATGSKIIPTYNPQGTIPCVPKQRSAKGLSSTVRSVTLAKGKQTQTGYPKSIIKISSAGKTVHPTQKPVALMEYLIKTYTNTGETVLDFAMGSGTTGVACKRLDRRFIGIELDPTYFKIARERIRNETKSGPS